MTGRMSRNEGEIPMRPFAKDRPRRDSNGRMYMSPKYKEAKRICAQHLRAGKHEMIEGDVQLSLVFNYSKGPFADIDNLAGGFMDAANGILWKDDKQVVSLLASRTKSDKDSIYYAVSDC